MYLVHVQNHLLCLHQASTPTALHAAPNQLSLLHKAQELSYKLNTLQGSHDKLASTAAAQTPPGTEVQTQTFGVGDQLSPQDCEDMQSALECSEHMVSRYTYIRSWHWHIHIATPFRSTYEEC